jgi:hypothetical protein
MSQDFARLHQAEDFTAENIFTNNIEGPSFDKQGRLFVVNFQKDGTIGYVKPDGKVELYITYLREVPPMRFSLIERGICFSRISPVTTF